MNDVIKKITSDLEEQFQRVLQDGIDKASRIADLERQLAEASAPQAGDADNVRDLLKALEELADVAQQCDSWESFPVTALEKAQAAIAKATIPMAAQAPVREVPEGWRLVPVKATEEWKDRLRDNGYCPTTVIDDVLTAAPLADELPGMWEQADLTGGATDCMPLPAAPVQQEGE